MNKILLSIAILALVISGFALSRPGQVVVRELVGAVSGPDVYFKQFLYDGMYRSAEKSRDGTVPAVIGDDIATSTWTLTRAQICNYPTLRVGFRTATGTLTFPTAANLITSDGCFNENGATKEIVFVNASSSAADADVDFAGAASSTISPRTLASSTGALGSTNYATTTLEAGGIAVVRGFRVTSSSQIWVVWTIDTYRGNK